MRPLKLLAPVFLLCSSFLLVPFAACAGSFEVSPTTLTLSAESRSGVVHVANRGTYSLFAQIEAMDWEQSDMKDNFTPSDTLHISPPVVRLAPGQQQTVRVVASADDSGKTERSYRLFVSELPDPASQKKDGIQILLQFIVPVFVVTEEKTASRLSWKTADDPEGILLTATNEGKRHLKLTELTVKNQGREIASRKKGFDYVLPGASQLWKLPVTASPTAGASLSVEALDETYGSLTASVIHGK